MKDLGKIALVGLPRALETALLEQFAADPELSAAAGGPLDASLIICAGPQSSLPVAVPVLPLETAKPQRLGAILRQARQMIDEPVLYLEAFGIGPYVFHPQEKTLAKGEAPEIALTDKEADILVYLTQQQGAAVSRDALLRHVWRYQGGIDTHTLETHIYRLRQKIEASADDPQLLVTAEGGYRLNR